VTGAPYAPFLDARLGKPPGLSPLDPAAWVACDADFAAQAAERDALLADPDDETVAALPGAEDALAEFRAALLAHLATRAGWAVETDALRRPDGATVALSAPTLTLAGRATQDDFLLMAPGGEEYRLIAGVLCFPSRWSLQQKLGRRLTDIHGPVPYYAEELAARVNRVFAALAPERPVWRVNWLASPMGALRLLMREGERRKPAADLTRFWLRTERQTLVKLPRTGVVAFGVKTTLTPFDDLTDEQRLGLHAALSRWTDPEIDYRGGPIPHEAALAALLKSRAA
jgi:hypothetical protein